MKISSAGWVLFFSLQAIPMVFAVDVDKEEARRFAYAYTQELKARQRQERQKHQKSEWDEWELATEVSYINYKEPGVMREKGAMYGLDSSYTYHKNFMLKADARFSYGQLDYKNSGTIDNIDNYMLELRGLGGYDFFVLEASTFTPYIGIGYRYLNDDSNGRISSTGAWGYEREIRYIYSPIGLETTIAFDNGYSIGTILEYDYFWDGTVKSYLGDVPGYTNIENDQDKGWGLRGSIKFKKKSKNTNFVIAPFIRYWNIKDSKTTTDTAGRRWIEPKNHSSEIGVKFAVEF